MKARKEQESRNERKSETEPMKESKRKEEMYCLVIRWRT